MSDIPYGADINIARMAIAWEIAKKSIPGELITANAQENLKLISNAYLKAYKAVTENQEIQS